MSGRGWEPVFREPLVQTTDLVPLAAGLYAADAQWRHRAPWRTDVVLAMINAQDRIYAMLSWEEATLSEAVAAREQAVAAVVSGARPLFTAGAVSVAGWRVAGEPQLDGRNRRLA